MDGECVLQPLADSISKQVEMVNLINLIFSTIQEWFGMARKCIDISSLRQRELLKLSGVYLIQGS